MILLDAYLIDTLPFHLATRELFALARSRLAPGGALGSNVIGALEGPRSRLFRSIFKTMRDVFRAVYVFPAPLAYDGGGDVAPQTVRNLIVVATDAAPIDASEVLRRASALVVDGTVKIDGFAAAAGRLYTAPIRVDDVPILTDDFAPVDAAR